MSKQFSIRRTDHWDISFWLIFDNLGGVRLTRGQPALGRNERSMSMSVKLPYALFKTPTLSASLTIDAPEPMVPAIDITAASEALSKALGVDIDLQVREAFDG
jgi:hypothetical protein